MRVMGVHSLTHDLGVALYEDGSIAHCIEEERLSRIKHHPGIEVGGAPPYNALRHVLKEASIELKDVDMIVHVGWPGYDFMKLDIIRRFYRDFARELDPNGNKTMFVDHHLAHAASTYYASGFDESLIFVVDGQGDWISTSLYKGKGGEIKKLEEYPPDQSLGFMYTRAASILGLGGFGFGEGKMMALASYGTPMEDFPSIIELENGRYHINPDYYEYFKRFRRNPRDELNLDHKNFAATVQNALEKAIIYVLNNTYEKHRVNNVSLAGGVALNCTMNGKIRTLPWVHRLFIQPAANDGGLCIGAAYLGAINSNEKIKPMSTIYLGLDIDHEIERFVATNNLNAQRLDNPYIVAARRIEEGKIVGWMQGKLEMGPRALGHRSLLGDPRKKEIKDRLNTIKSREDWRPVAPSLIYTDQKRYFNTEDDGLEYMTISVEMNDTAKREIPAAIHVDNTSRVQIIKAPDDPFYKLIEHFYKLTGIPAVLNTSLNAKDDPLCSTIQDGIKLFYTTPVDDLFIGSWWLKKE